MEESDLFFGGIQSKRVGFFLDHGLTRLLSSGPIVIIANGNETLKKAIHLTA